VQPGAAQGKGRGSDECLDFLCFVKFPRSLKVFKHTSHVKLPFVLELDVPAAAVTSASAALVTTEDAACDAATADTSDAVSSSDGDGGARDGGNAALAKCSRSPQWDRSSRSVVATGAGETPLPLPLLSRNEMDMASGGATGDSSTRLRFGGTVDSIADVMEEERFKPADGVCITVE
jgi:hypothetical protein